MADKTRIEWTDATWNPITGCAVVSPGCTNCYAMKLAGTRLRNIPSRVGLTRDTKAGPVWTGEIRFNEAWLDEPLRYRRPRMIFVCAHGDLFAEGVTDAMLDRVFAVMALAPQHTFQVLTKRPERMRDYCRRTDERERHPCMTDAALMAATGRWNTPALDLRVWPLPNVWLGVSAEDQRRADERIPVLLDTPAAVRWVSAEPLLGLIDFTFFRQPNMGSGAWWFDALNEDRAGWFADEAATIPTDSAHDHRGYVPRLDWIVVGGESGHGARPMHPDWPRAIRDQCAAAGVPFLFKQWGEWGTACIRVGTGEAVFRRFDTFERWVDKASTWVAGGICLDASGQQLQIGADFMRARDEGRFPVTIMHRVGKTAAGRRLDGVLHDAYPQSEEIVFG